MSVARLNQEWLYSNLSKAYPLAESIGGSTRIPPSLLADAFILVAGVEDSQCSAYISEIVTTSNAITLSLAINVSGDVYDLGSVATFPTDSEIGACESFDIDSDTLSVMGKIVIGDASSCRNLPPVLQLTEEDGLLASCCVRGITGVVTGLIVDGVRYSGDVTLEAGDGIAINTSLQDDGSTVLTFTSIDYSPPSENTEITSDAELLEEAVERFGKPIRTINGVAPDASGNITIRGDEVSTTSDKATNDLFTVQVTSIGDGEGAVNITLSKELSCDIDETFAVIMSNIAQISSRLSTVDAHITAVDNANANLAMRLVNLR